MGETKSHIFINTCKKVIIRVTLSGFRIIGSNFQNQKSKRKITASLMIRETRSSLNTQEISIQPKRFI